ncbi:conserved hypothetical protein [uncultured Eubacteriales bacterium]|uniref:TFIIB-type zinc ribbon-containing protein n=1 Tax=uncultured Eubacteriales bacterium TaxID=172733 RepID=A0A212J408_9FIRM|nr:conserved hypothetical protein [uncultured Eubacteriales bacterium]
MDKLPDHIVRFDVVRVEYGKKKMCQCLNPHYEIDYQNRLVYCNDCGAVVDPLEALSEIARHYERIEAQTKELLEQRRLIANYHPRRVVLKELEKQYIRAEHNKLDPTCPHCHRPFPLAELLNVSWCNSEFAKRMEAPNE